MAPTHKDGLSEDNAAKSLFDDEEEERLRVDVPVIILKAAGLVAAIFLAILPASPKVPAMTEIFMVPAAISLMAAIVWASWFETLFLRMLILTSTGGVILLVIMGIISVLVGAGGTVIYSTLPVLIALVASAALTAYLIIKHMLYPKLEFFLPVTAILCIIGIIQVF